MSRQYYEYTKENFQCTAAQKSVEIRKKINCLQNNRGETIARAEIQMDCSNQDYCIVCKNHGNGKTYDWKKCPYLQENPK